ncbi:hypothetical protein BDR07DRAFT_1609861 [Suillus spraguei]|nr:hypothetical protein BDR07DRAFT_1609861 [Suillus spraguei]
MLDNGEVIGQLETPWKDLLDSGDKPFDISFPPVRDVHPSLTLKATVVHVYDNQDDALFDSIVECQIARHADAGHSRFATYVTSEIFSPALTNLACSRLEGYTQNYFKDIDSITALFCEALALRPQGHIDPPLYLYHLALALVWCCRKDIAIPVYIREFTQLYFNLLSLCPKGTYLHSITTGEWNRRVLELCLLGNEHRLEALDKLACVLRTRFQQYGSINDIDECIQYGREAVSLCPVGHPECDSYLNHLAYSLRCRFYHQGNIHDLNEAISLYEKVLPLHDVHAHRYSSLNNLGLVLFIRFKQHSDINDIIRAISLHREALTLCPPGHRSCEKLDTTDDLDETIDLYRDSLRLRPHGHPHRHITVLNSGSALSYHFMHTQENVDVFAKSYWRLCLHPDRYFSYLRLKQAYLSRCRVQHNLLDLSLAVENFRLASQHPTKGFPRRIKTAWNWATTAEQHDHTSEVYNLCSDLIDSHLAARSSIISQHEVAATFSGARSLPLDAASCAIRRDNLQRAVELVEQGRGQHWSLASCLISSLEDLEFTNPNLAYQFSEFSKRLSDAQSFAVSINRAAAEWAEIQYRRFSEQWRAVVAEIRNIQGFSRFLLPPL